MPRFVAVYTMMPENVATFRARPKAEQEAIEETGVKAWEKWRTQHAAAIVGTDIMVGKTLRVTPSGTKTAQNSIAGFVIVDAADIDSAARISRITPTSASSPATALTSCPY